MSESQKDPGTPGPSRRRVLKGAVGAAGGLAAWSAPKIGVVPAYALTNSTGVFDNVCYYIAWAAGTNQRWARGPTVGGAGKDTGRADSIARSGFDATYTWNDVFGVGQDLVVDVSGAPQPHDPMRNGGPGNQHNQRDHTLGPDLPYANLVGGTTAPATITLTSANPGCVFEDRGAGVTYDGPPTNPGCTLPGPPRAGWSSTGSVPTAEVILGASSGTLTNVRDGTGRNYVIFNINCS